MLLWPAAQSREGEQGFRQIRDTGLGTGRSLGGLSQEVVNSLSLEVRKQNQEDPQRVNGGL